MAKRKAPIKGKARARKAGSAKTKKAAPPRKPRAKQERLPEMDIPKVRSLDRICASLSEVRERRNTDNAEEKGLLQNALRELIKNDTTIYKAHGVELVHVKGDDKIRMRLVNDDNDSDDLGDERREAVETVDDDADEDEAIDEE